MLTFAPRAPRAPLAASLVALLIAGCGAGAAKVVPVEGGATLGGQPISSGTVTLKPLAATDAPPTVGTIKDGQYTLVTGAQTGAPLGKYKVTVNVTVPSNPDDPYSLPKSLVPKKYTDPSTTDLEIEVVASPAAGAYDLKLTP